MTKFYNAFISYGPNLVGVLKQPMTESDLEKFLTGDR